MGGLIAFKNIAFFNLICYYIQILQVVFRGGPEDVHEEEKMHTPSTHAGRRRRWLFWGTVFLLLAIMGTVVAFMNGNDNMIRESQPQPATSSAPQAPPIIEDAPSTVNWQQQRIDNARQQFPQHYQCRNYGSTPTARELIPTAYAQATITYDQASRTYRTRGDGRIQFSSTTFVDSGDGQSTEKVRFTWTYNNGLAHFAAYETYRAMAPGSAWGWAPIPTYDKLTGQYTLDVTPANGPVRPVYLIVATDPECDAHATLPKTFSWEALADRGVAFPEGS